MIIFGWRTVKSTKESGEFDCPQCESVQRFRLRSARRFFTLYFIPLIPLKKLGDYVECQNCNGTFIPNVLNYREPNTNNTTNNNTEATAEPNESQFLAEYQKAVKKSLILMMLADGIIDEDEKKAILKITNDMTRGDISMAELDVEIKIVRLEGLSVGDYLKDVAPLMNDYGKEMVIKSAYEIAMADDIYDPSEKALLEEMAKSLDMTKAHLNGVIKNYKVEKEQ